MGTHTHFPMRSCLGYVWITPEFELSMSHDGFSLVHNPNRLAACTYVYSTHYMLLKSGLGTTLFHNYTLPFWCTEHWSSGNLTAPAHVACAEYQNVIIIIPFISDWCRAFQLCYKVLIHLKSGLQVIGVKVCNLFAIPEILQNQWQ